MWNELCQGNICRPKQHSVEGQVEKKSKNGDTWNEQNSNTFY